jgi:hypothetical protein
MVIEPKATPLNSSGVVREIRGVFRMTPIVAVNAYREFGRGISPENYVRPGKASGHPGFTPPVCVNSAGNRAQAVRERRTLKRAAASNAASAGYAITST